MCIRDRRPEFVQCLGDITAARVQAGGEHGMRRNRNPERRLADFQGFVVERLTEQLAAWRRGVQSLAAQSDQNRAADVGGTPLERCLLYTSRCV